MTCLRSYDWLAIIPCPFAIKNMTLNVKQHLNKSTYTLDMVKKAHNIIYDFFVSNVCLFEYYLMLPMDIVETR